MRRKSVTDYGNVEHIKDRINFIYADMTDIVSLINAMRTSQADEVYNLAAQSFVGTSWEQPIATAEIDAVGVTNMLEAIKIGRLKTSKILSGINFRDVWACSGNTTERKYSFLSFSIWSCKALYGHWITKNYREL